MPVDPPRLEKETRKSYAAFLHYCYIPAGQRTLSELSRQLGKSVNNYRQLATKFRWHERVDEFDAQFRKTDLEIIENARKEATTSRALREIQRQTDCYNLAQKMLQRINELMECETTEVKEEVQPNGSIRKKRNAKGTNIYVPVAMMVREMGKLYELAVTDKITEKPVTAQQDEGNLRGMLSPGSFKLWKDEPQLEGKAGDPISDPMDKVIDIQPEPVNGRLQ